MLYYSSIVLSYSHISIQRWAVASYKNELLL